MQVSLLFAGRIGRRSPTGLVLCAQRGDQPWVLWCWLFHVISPERSSISRDRPKLDRREGLLPRRLTHRRNEGEEEEYEDANESN